MRRHVAVGSICVMLAAVFATHGDAGARPAAVAAATEGSCAQPDGVTVVIDFQQLGGVSLRCGEGSAVDGFDALGRAGISFRTATRSPGFLCRIADLPTTDPCITPAPATAYWSYWLASRGGPWCYSNLGAGNRRPPPGTVEGWSFSLTTDGTTAPPPRVPSPGPIPGVTPASLGPADCDSTPPAASQGTTQAIDPLAASPGPDAPAPAGSPAPSGVSGATAATLDPDAGPIAGDAVTTTIAASTTASDSGAVESTPGPAASSAGDRPRNDNGRDFVEAGGVDLGDDGTTDNTSPLGVVLAVALIGALGAGAFLARRRAAHH